MTIQQIPIWLDCDPGNDDAFAILLSIFDPRFHLLGISTVHGNAPLEWTTHNALGLLDILNVHNIKVYTGEERPLVNEPKYALNVHGKTGIGGLQLPLQTQNQPINHHAYLSAMYLAICQNAGEICLVCTGTLTNVAKLVEKHPDVVEKIKYISIMGGSFGFGNATPYAEFNFHTDPHAAELIVREFQNKIVLSPLNLTHKVIATPEVREQNIYNPSDEKRNSSLRKGFYDVLMFYSLAYKTRKGFAEGPPLHDPIAVYSILPLVDLDPEEYGYKYVRRRIKVETSGKNEGESVIILQDSGDGDGDGAYIGEDLDKGKFWKSIADALERADLNL